MQTRSLFALAVAATLVFSLPSAAADPLVKPVPIPDMSRLSAPQSEQLRNARVDFEKTKATLVGDALAEAYAMMGAIYARAGFHDAAGVALGDAVVLAPKDGRWVYAQGILARVQKQNAVAQNYFDLAFDLDHEYLPIRVAVARSKLDNGDVEGARKLLADYIATHADQAMPYAMLGEIALRQKRYADAIAQTERALALDPNANALYATLSTAQAAAGDAKAAAASHQKAGVTEPVLNDPLAAGLLAPAAAVASTAQNPSDAMIAAQALALHQYGDARKHLDLALKKQPDDSTLLALYARVEAAAGDLAAAKSRAAAAVTADSNNALAHLSQGLALEMNGDDRGAERAYEQAIRVNARLAEPRMLLGNLLMRVGRNDDAVEQFRAGVRLDLRNAQAWTRLVAADFVAGQCVAALRDLSDLLAKDATDRPLLQLFVRSASTCPAASADQRRGALEYGAKLYREAPGASASEAYALALAANGKWDDAIKIQEGAMFVLVRNGNQALLPAYRQFLKEFQAHTLPARPWPADAAVFHPARIAPDPKPVAAPVANKK